MMIIKNLKTKNIINFQLSNIFNKKLILKFSNSL